MKKILLELSDELASQVDLKRGNQPRVAWIRDAITERLNVPCETIHKGDAATREDADVAEAIASTAPASKTASPSTCKHPNWHGWSKTCPDCEEKMR